jgi:hypothetical protein
MKDKKMTFDLAFIIQNRNFSNPFFMLTMKRIVSLIALIAAASFTAGVRQ